MKEALVQSSLLFLSLFLEMMNQKKSYTFEEIKQKIVRYCVYQDRCHQEVEQKMREFLLVPEAKEEIMLYLMREDFLNEERFARSYVRGKFNHKHWGRKKIINGLKQKNISSRLIDMALQEIDDEDYRETLKRLYEKYYANLNEKNTNIQKQKTIKYLIDKGFEYNIILEVLGI